MTYDSFSFHLICLAVRCYNTLINAIPGGGGGDFDKAFMPEGVAFDFMDSPQGADI